MMDEENTSLRLGKSRSVLGDLTNRIGKRGSSGIEESGNKDVVKRICVSPRPCTEINSLKSSVISGFSKRHTENVSGLGSGYAADSEFAHCSKGKTVEIENTNVHGGNKDIKILDLMAGDVISESINNSISVDNEAASQNYTDTNIPVTSVVTEAPGCGKLDPSKDNIISDIAQVADDNNYPSLEHSFRKNVVDPSIVGGGECSLSSSKIYNEENDPNLLDLGRGDAIDSSNTEVDNDMDDHHADNFALSQSGSIDCQILPELQESTVLGVDGSAKLKEDECAYMSGGIDSIRTCSCSFCTKAAYIWLDLHHQDIKARLSAMKKSQKEASILAERSCRNKVTEKHGAESSTRVTKLESHLMHQWRSLFQHMVAIWEEEGNKLEASLMPLSDLREKCKTDLEFINANPKEKH